MLGLAFVLLQYMISAKAGLVNYIDGQANVHLHEQVAEGSPIETQAHGHVELLLTPGVFLRIGNNSTVALDSVELSHAVVRVIDGSALIEVTQIEKGTPIKVVTGGLETMVVSPVTVTFVRSSRTSWFTAPDWLTKNVPLKLVLCVAT